MGSYNRKQCCYCEAYIYDGYVICDGCASAYNSCTVCGYTNPAHGPECPQYVVPSPLLTDDMILALHACRDIVAAMDQLPVGIYRTLPPSVRAAYHSLAGVTPEDGWDLPSTIA